MSELMIFPSIMEGYKSRKDGSIAITLGTQEMVPATAAKLAGYNQKFLYVLFKEDTPNNEEQEMMKFLETSDDNQSKSQSQRMRNTLYVLFKQDSEGFSSFVMYYEHKMNKFIDSLKLKIK